MASRGANGHFVPAFAAAVALIGLIVLLLADLGGMCEASRTRR